MGSIELRERFYGSGYVGTVQAEPALSWSDRAALSQAAAASAASATELRVLNDQVGILGGQLASLGGVLAGIGFGQGMIIRSLAELEQELGLRLEQQTRVLVKQSDYLARIDEALRTPAKTRAAERIADSGELLRRGRWERALAVASEAIEGDPNNPAGFRAAGWACLGLRRLEDAKRSFFECAEAADGDERAQALRQAARLERAITGPREALALLDRMDDGAVDFEQRAADYDRAIYLTDLGRFDDAKRLLEQAIVFDERFALTALTDDLLREHTELTYVVHAYIDGLEADLGRLRKDLERDLVAAQQALDGHPSATDSDYPKWGRSEHDALVSRVKEMQQRLETARSRHGGRLTALRTELEQALGPEAESLRVDADAWRNGFERALAQIEREQVARQREREAVAAHQRAMIPVRDALQARLDEAALRLAAEEDAEVFSWTPWISLAPDVVVRSALVKRTARRFRAKRRWLVTLNGARDDVVIERVD